MNHLGTTLTVSLTLYGLGMCLFLISEHRRPQATLAWMCGDLVPIGLMITSCRERSVQQKEPLLRHIIERAPARVSPLLSPKMKKSRDWRAKGQPSKADRSCGGTHISLTTCNRGRFSKSAVFYDRLMEDIGAAPECPQGTPTSALQPEALRSGSSCTSAGERELNWKFRRAAILGPASARKLRLGTDHCIGADGESRIPGGLAIAW